jgi:hypothetical protein
MSCSHADSCPLFPLLNASLASWRTSYCDDEVAWHDCARYKRSLQGRPVPLALLPNGMIPAASFTEEVVATQHLLEEDGAVATVEAPAAEASAGHESDESRDIYAREEDTDVPTYTRWWHRLKEWMRGAA